MRIIVVEHDLLLLTQLKELTEAWGYELLVAADRLQAWQFLKLYQDEPLLILLDWGANTISQQEFCRQLQALETRQRYYLMIMIRSGNKEDVLKGLAAGADDYLMLPATAGELKSRLLVGRRIGEYQQRLEKVTAELLVANQEIQRISKTDLLTGVPNRESFEERYREEWRRATREGTSFSLLLINLDFFKKYNDNYGHSAGDHCLRKVAESLSGNLARAGDVVARYSGEEFMVILPNTDSVGAAVMAEFLRCSISNLPVDAARGGAGKITASIGVATTWPCSDTDPGELVEQARQAMRQAKLAGRNNVRQY